MTPPQRLGAGPAMSELRNAYPALERLTYLNAGTNGPISSRAVVAAQRELARQLAEGRGPMHFRRRLELMERVRARFARVLGCVKDDIALTTSTTEAISVAINGLRLEAGDEVVIGNEEHIGLLGPIQALRDLCQIRVREVPLASIAGAIGPRTRLIACSHVTWISGSIAPEDLADIDVTVLLDGAQSVGALPTPVEKLGCDLFAGSAQKWLCGPDGVGMLYVAPTIRDRLDVTARGFLSYADPDSGLAAGLYPDARRFDTAAPAAEALAATEAALDVLEEVGWDEVYVRGPALARAFAERAVGLGRELCRRSGTNLVSFSSADPVEEREYLLARGIVVRPIPGTRWIRASFGAWNDESDIERLLAALA